MIGIRFPVIRLPAFQSAMCRRRGGQVLILTLLSITLLVGLVFYVYNIGDVMNRRMGLQSTADSVAISGTVWMARSMNVVAMDNVATSRMLASVVVLDSLPLATNMAASETDAWQKGLAGQLARGVPKTPGGQVVRDGLQSLGMRISNQHDILAAVDQTLNSGSFSMDQATHWSVRGMAGPVPHGSLWRAAEAMDHLSVATAGAAGVLSQADANSFGRAVGTPGAFLVPVVPQLPSVRGTFDDYQPVLAGKEYVDGVSALIQPAGGDGGAVTDVAFPHRLGPWARLYRWRNYVTNVTDWQYVPSSGGAQVLMGQGAIQIGGQRVGTSAITQDTSSGYMQPVASQTVGYTTFGPYRWMMNQIDSWANDHSGIINGVPWSLAGQLPDTNFYRYLNDISHIKLVYMFPAGVNKTPILYHHPQWITNLNDARLIVVQPGVRASYTMFYLIQIASRVPETDSAYLSPGTFRTNSQRPITITSRGWVDPSLWNVPQVADWMWKDSYTYETTADADLGIAPSLGADGQPVFQPVYLTDWYVFGGVDIGGEEQVSNPCNWDSLADLPAPLLLDTRQGDYDPQDLDSDKGIRRTQFTFLGAATKDTQAPLWTKRFSTGPPGQMFAVAQAKLFNNSSWDLWTQDWQAQLTPVSQWDDWQNRLSAGMSDAGAVQDFVNLSDLQTVQTLMSQFNSNMAGIYMNH